MRQRLGLLLTGHRLLLLAPRRVLHELKSGGIPSDVNMGHRRQLLGLQLLLGSEAHAVPQDPFLFKLQRQIQDLVSDRPQDPAHAGQRKPTNRGAVCTTGRPQGIGFAGRILHMDIVGFGTPPLNLINRRVKVAELPSSCGLCRRKDHPFQSIVPIDQDFALHMPIDWDGIIRPVSI